MNPLLYLPILTTVVAAVGTVSLARRYRSKGGGPHLLWWTIGMATYGIGTLTEAWTTLFGWQPTVFRLWYVSGALLGGFPLAQGTIYLLMSRRFADFSARIAIGVILLGTLLVFLSPLDLQAAEAHRLSGRVLEWQWVRAVSPFINLYALAFLAGGAAISARRYRRDRALAGRFVGNLLIAVGAVLPGIGGASTRFGHVEVLYVTELIGLVLIYTGYRCCVATPLPQSRRSRVPSPAAAGLLLALVLPTPPVAAATAAEANPAETAAEAVADVGPEADEAPVASFFASTTVTATGQERDTFGVATPVTVIPTLEIQSKAATSAAQLLREHPGVDVNGVGPNQARPVIRGQRGLRILFLEDGLRLNNARRQTDFGEITGLVDLDSVAAVEVVRGPSSVLYGSDAIGGVLNLVSRSPYFSGEERSAGSLELRYGSAGEMLRAAASAAAKADAFTWQLGGAWREAASYEAPEGSYGDIRLGTEAVVNDTGVRDSSLWGSLLWTPRDSHRFTLRLQRYRAEDAGFGYVRPEDYAAPADSQIRITYPFQDFDRATLSYGGAPLSSSLADTLEVRGFVQSNERELVNDIDIDIGPIAPGFPSSSVAADTRNLTDLDTLGLRTEAIKFLGDRHLLTYGLEAYADDSFNTDFSTTQVTIRFPFPPFERVSQKTDPVANAPNAENRSYAFFAQEEWTASDRLRLAGGLRYQNVATRAQHTAGWDTSGLDFEDDNVVWALTGTYQATDELNFLASWGKGFRAPNIIERLFNGPTPEGSGFQILNPDLASETSDNWDLGLKYRRREAFCELVAFRSELEDGIIQYFLSPSEIAALPADVRQDVAESGAQFVVQQRNAEGLRYEGVELALGYRSPFGLTVGGNYTYIDGERLDSTNPPTGDTYKDKLFAYVRYNPDGARSWIEVHARRHGSQPANLDPNEPVPPVGTILPGFTVVGLGGGVRLLERGGVAHDLTVWAENLTNQLYAEFSNATFFRPEPGRHVSASYRVRF